MKALEYFFCALALATFAVSAVVVLGLCTIAVALYSTFRFLTKP